MILLGDLVLKFITQVLLASPDDILAVLRARMVTGALVKIWAVLAGLQFVLHDFHQFSSGVGDRGLLFEEKLKNWHRTDIHHWVVFLFLQG